MEKSAGATIDVSVDCVVFGFDGESLNALLIEQGLPETGTLTAEKTQIALPGDMVLEDESLDDSAARVLKELTSLEGIYLKQFHTFGNPQRVKGLKDQDWLRSFRANPDRFGDEVVVRQSPSEQPSSCGGPNSSVSRQPHEGLPQPRPRTKHARARW